MLMRSWRTAIVGVLWGAWAMGSLSESISANDLTTTNTAHSIRRVPQASVSFAAYYEPDGGEAVPTPNPNNGGTKTPPVINHVAATDDVTCCSPSPCGHDNCATCDLASCTTNSYCGCDCNAPCAFRDGWYAGAEAVWAKPYLQYNLAYVVAESSTGPGNLNTLTNTEGYFEYDFAITPRIWIGYENECGFGIRARYWRFDENAREIAFIGPNASVVPTVVSSPSGINDEVVLGQSLELHVADIEATQRFNWCCTDVQFAFGVRIARIEQNTFEDGIYPSRGSPTQIDFGSRRTTFDGAGPTVAFDLHRPIGCTGFAFLGGARAAILLGRFDSTFDGQTNQTIDNVVTVNRSHVFGSQTVVRACGEANFGIEWKHCLDCGAELFANCMIEGQAWQEAAANSRGINGNLGLLGIGASVGIHR